MNIRLKYFFFHLCKISSNSPVCFFWILCQNTLWSNYIVKQQVKLLAEMPASHISASGIQSPDPEHGSKSWVPAAYMGKEKLKFLVTLVWLSPGFCLGSEPIDGDDSCSLDSTFQISSVVGFWNPHTNRNFRIVTWSLVLFLRWNYSVGKSLRLVLAGDTEVSHNASRSDAGCVLC